MHSFLTFIAWYFAVLTACRFLRFATNDRKPPKPSTHVLAMLEYAVISAVAFTLT